MEGTVESSIRKLEAGPCLVGEAMEGNGLYPTNTSWYLISRNDKPGRQGCVATSKQKNMVQMRVRYVYALSHVNDVQDALTNGDNCTYMNKYRRTR